MGVVTLKLDDEIERKLRRKAGRTKGASRGAISKSVEEAISYWLNADEPFPQKSQTTFLAVQEKTGEKIAEAESLDLLSKKLKELSIDPRDVLIESLPAITKKRRMGLRTTKVSR